jgi:hypothetical protein
MASRIVVRVGGGEMIRGAVAQLDTIAATRMPRAARRDGMADSTVTAGGLMDTLERADYTPNPQCGPRDPGILEVV